jgi:purine-cytosine permease-like protein
MMVILLANQWAAQDGNVYVAVNGAQNVLSAIPGWRRQHTVIGVGVVAGVLILFTPNLQTTLHIITGIGATTVPVASTIMAIDVFVLPRLFGLRRPLHRVAAWNELSLGNWPAILALLTGTFVGIFAGGLIPGTPGFGRDYIGFPAVQAWLTGGLVYLAIVAVVARGERVDRVLGYARVSDTHEARDVGPSARQA